MIIEDQLRQALADHAATVAAPADRWAEIEAEAGAVRQAEARRRSRRRVSGLAVLGLAAAATAAAVLLPALNRAPAHRVVVTPTHQGTVTPQPSPSSTVVPTTVAPGTGSSYLPLYPFSSVQQANAWQAAYTASGAQPWHLDAGQTALNFAHFLGYSDVTQVLGAPSDATGDHVTVGFLNPNGGWVAAAVIHLRRFGSGPDAPWEVVGTDDTAAFSVTVPRYGAVASSPLTVGGAIVGVDESIRVEVLQLSSGTPLGSFCCLPAGNSGAPWSATVAFHGASGNVVIVAASTGGGLNAVGRFAVTGVRTSSGATPGL